MSQPTDGLFLCLDCGSSGFELRNGSSCETCNSANVRPLTANEAETKANHVPWWRRLLKR